MNSKEKAPLSSAVRAQLESDAKDLIGAAKRKGTTLDGWDLKRETEAVKDHFELGCWMHHLSSKIYRSGADGLAARIECVRRLFANGIVAPGYRFFTVFEFGERQFDTCFEMGDGDEVVKALVKMAKKAPGSELARCVDDMGWLDHETGKLGVKAEESMQLELI